MGAFRIRLSVLVFLTCNGIAFYSASQVYTFPTSAGNLGYHWTRLGTPPQEIFMRLNFQLDSLVSVGAECGMQLRTNCPKYCRHVPFRHAFCPTECYRMNSVEMSMNCNHYPLFSHYSSNKSTTFRDEPAKRWGARLANTRQLYGLYARDWLQIREAPKAYVPVSEVRFVRATSLDARLNEGLPLLLGLAPSENSLALQLFQQRLTPAPIVGLSTHHINNKPWHVMMLGGRDNAQCEPWVERKSASKRAWLLHVDEIALMNVTVRDQKVTFSKDFEETRLPRHFAKELLRRRVFRESNFEFLAFEDADADVGLELRFGAPTATFRIHKKYVRKDEYDPKLNSARLSFYRIGESTPYVDEEMWIFGTQFLKSFCLYFDYVDMTIGLAHSKVV